jgi:MFS family permease
MGLLMIGHSLAFPSAGALLSRNTPPERQGSTMGLMMASNAVGRIVAPPLFGLIYDKVGPRRAVVRWRGHDRSRRVRRARRPSGSPAAPHALASRPAKE